MNPARNSSPLGFIEAAEASGRERRRHGRLRCDDLLCNVGQIQDLSASGMLVYRRGGVLARLGDELQIVIQHLDACMAVNVKTVRCDRLGFRKRLYGFEFIDLTPEQRSRLTALARIATDRLTFARRK